MLSTVAKIHTGCSVQTGPLSAAGGFQAVTDACCARLTGVVQTSGSCRGSCLWQAVPLRLWELVGIPRPGGGGASSLWEFCLTAQLPPICTSPPGALDLTQLKPGVGCRAPPGWQQLSILIRWRWFQEPHRGDLSHQEPSY